MTYKVIAAFKDKTDEEHLYRIGDTFPRKGKRPAKERKNELVDKGFLKEVD